MLGWKEYHVDASGDIYTYLKDGQVYLGARSSRCKGQCVQGSIAQERTDLRYDQPYGFDGF